MYNLIVVDMQVGFETAKVPRVISNAVKFIKKAVKDDANIIFVEYTGHGPTLIALKEACLSYEKQWYVYKDHDNGARRVRQIVEHAALDTSAFHYIGVNLCSCVLETTLTMSKTFKDSSHVLHKSAVNTCNACEFDKDLSLYTHVEVIE